MSRRGICLAAGAALVAAAVVATRWPPINDVTTGLTPEYPDLQPGEYPLPPAELFATVRETARKMTGWRVTAEDAGSHVLHAVAWVPLTPFHDDVTITLEPTAGGSRVIVRSRSRVGRGDLGVNARRIRAFLRALDRELSSRSH
jgi:uncharacterized protein (DUF1499 family)